MDRTQPILLLRPGLPERQTHDYIRYGTTTLFAALNVLSGEVLGDCMPRHRHQEFVRFLERIEGNTPRRLTVHLIWTTMARILTRPWRLSFEPTLVIIGISHSRVLLG